MDINLIYFLIFFFPISFCDCIKFYNYTLYRGIPVDAKHLEYFQNLTEVEYVNFWRLPGRLFKPVDLVVDPEHKELFLKEANNLGLYITTLIEDVQKAFDKQSVKQYIRRKMESFDWNDYYRLNDIYEWLRDLANTYPTEMKVNTIGRSHENREILAVEITLKGSKMRSKVIVEGGIHAREWISPAFVTYFINELIHAPYSNDTEFKDIAMTYEWFFVPVLNPDGYEYSHTNNRMWRKNRNQMGSVDLNRNFDHAFGTTGVSFRMSSDTFCGLRAFSEPESQAMASFIESKSQQLEYYFAFHSYGQYMIMPYANLKAHVENFDTVYKMCSEAKTKIAEKYNTAYTIGTAFDTVGYMTSGVSGCWVKAKLRVPYVVTFELRDSGYHGFSLPPEKIRPTCLETMDGVLSLLKPRTKTYARLEGKYNYDSGVTTNRQIT
ncbi:zinc carboxypeptidase-like [Spodoptera litura]|uniref:Zinc carboxypeptidase-like n=1 Tax=Spodoptera litura TaxID=69820 RepID=A0A9J7IM74_SPOLT|nr:zinc carboxypeptidase-like [Spodoptera litura]